MPFESVPFTAENLIWFLASFVLAGLVVLGAIFSFLKRRPSKSEVAFGNRMASSIEIGRRVMTGGKVGEVVDIAGQKAVVQLTARNGSPFTVRRSLDRLQVVA